MTPDTHRALETWLREESAGLRALARGILRQEADAEDCVQDAWLSAVRTPPRNSPRAWLRAVVRHAAFRRGRDAGRRARREHAAARPDASPPVDETAARLEVRQRVLRAV